MGTININVKNKIARSMDEVIVCGNSDYVVNFHFDEEWNDAYVKTARFIYNNTSVDVVFEGKTVAVPVITNATMVAVGVFAGDLRTTTPALITCNKSILCEKGLPPDPTPDVYAQIIELLNQSGGSGKDGVSPTVEVVETENGHRVKITDVEGEHIFEVANGANGYTPKKGVDYFDGANGYTPQKGVDYFDGEDYVLTEADKTEIAEQAAALIDTALAAAIGSGAIV